MSPFCWKVWLVTNQKSPPHWCCSIVLEWQNYTWNCYDFGGTESAKTEKCLLMATQQQQQKYLKNDFIRTSYWPPLRHTSPHNNNNIVHVSLRTPITQHIRTMKHSVLHCRSLLLWFASVTYGWIGKSEQRSASFIVYWHSKPLLLTRIVVLAHTAGLNHWSQCLY